MYLRPRTFALTPRQGGGLHRWNLHWRPRTFSLSQEGGGYGILWRRWPSSWYVFGLCIQIISLLSTNKRPRKLTYLSLFFVLLLSLSLQSTSISMNTSMSINTSTSMNMSMPMTTRRRKISRLGRRRPWKAAVMTPWQLPSADPGTTSLRSMLPRANKYYNQVGVVA